MDNINLVCVGITTRCNATCKFCAAIQGLKADDKINDLDLDLVFKSLLPKVNQIILGGNFGDAIFHPNLLNFLKESINQYPDVDFSILTNGSIDNKEFWRTLGGISDDKIKVTFGLDGLEDTHCLYRKTDFNTVINNLKTYVKYNGNAIWQFLIFEHNQHQVKQAIKLAKSLGCKEFILLRSDFYDSELSAPKGIISLFELKNRLKNNTPFCYWKEQKKIYINEYGEVHPCCHIGPYFNSDKFDDIKHLYLENKDKINLHNHDIDTIMKNPYLNYIYENFKNVSKCKNVCSINKHLISHVRELKHIYF